MLNFLARSLCFIILKLFFHLEISGKENLPKKGGFIFASNHTSFLDPVVAAASCPRRLDFMARDDLFDNLLFGWFISSLGAFPLKRNSADISALKEAIRRVRSGRGLVVFPQGDRMPSAHHLEGESLAGVGFLAAKAGLPVVPAFIQGTDKALPVGAKSIRRHSISVRIGKQINIEKGISYQDISGKIMQEIRLLASGNTKY